MWGAAEAGECPQAKGSSPRPRAWRFVLIRTGRVSSVEAESVSSVRKRKAWFVGGEGGLFSYRKGRVSLVEPEGVACVYRKDKTWERNQVLRWGRPPALVRARTTMLGWPRPTRGPPRRPVGSKLLRKPFGFISKRTASCLEPGLLVSGYGFEVFRPYPLSIIIPKVGLQEKTPQAASSQPRLSR